MTDDPGSPVKEEHFTNIELTYGVGEDVSILISCSLLFYLPKKISLPTMHCNSIRGMETFIEDNQELLKHLQRTNVSLTITSLWSYNSTVIWF